jgi:hypothetical protein
VSTTISDGSKRVTEERFVIGPVVNEEFWRNERASMALERGPCKFLDYQRSVNIVSTPGCLSTNDDDSGLYR